MTDARPGADELRVRGILRQRGVGPDAGQPLPPMPSHRPHGFEDRPRDWLDDFLEPHDEPPAPAATPAGDTEPSTGEPDTEPPTAPQRPQLSSTRLLRHAAWRREAAPAQHPATADPRRSLVEAWDAVPHRVRRLAANASAAGLGWSMHLVDFTQNVCAWVDLHGPADAQSIFFFGLGVACVALHQIGRSKWAPVAWLCSVPAASAVLGVLLYAPNT